MNRVYQCGNCGEIHDSSELAKNCHNEEDKYIYEVSSCCYAFIGENENEEKVCLNCGGMEEKVYEEQTYLVKFDLGLVDVNISVHHQNQTELTREEIIEEALGYAEDAGIKLEERDLFEIETLIMK